MSYEPFDLDQVQQYLASMTGLSASALGIVGDSSHTGGYHVGNDRLRASGRLNTDYSKAESSRDRPGTDAASALDIGSFSKTINGYQVTLRSLSLDLVEACQGGDPRSEAIREIIYSPDGTIVRRWDRLGIRSSGDSSHRTHTHLSFFRDSEGRRHRPDNLLGLIVEIMEGETMTPEQTAEVLRRLEVIDNATRATAGCEAEVDYRGAAGDTWKMPNRLLARLTDLGQKLDQVLARPGVSLDAAAVEAIASQVADALIADTGNSLTPEDLVNVRSVTVAAVKTALREGAGS